jgi:putative ABC transport system substrate-binding protein
MASHIERRNFLATLGGAAAWPLAARAQQAGKVPTIGILGSGTPATQGHWYAAFVQRLRELGWIDGRTVAIEYRWAEGRDEHAGEIAAEFVRRKVDVIVTSATAGIVAAKQATSVIPVNNREYAEVGGLISYGPSQSDAYRRAGVYVGRILSPPISTFSRNA